MSFPEYMRDMYAPDATPNSLYCDGIGSCNLGSCKNINQSLPHDDKQAAYYVFEEIAGTEHLHQGIEKALTESARYMHGSTKELVSVFTSAKDIEKQRLEREKMRDIGMQIGTSVLLVAGALGSVVPFTGLSEFLAVGTRTAESVSKAIEGVRVGLGLVTSSYIALTGLVGKIRDNPHLSEDLEDHFARSWNEIAHEVPLSISDDLRDLMIGAKNAQGVDLASVLKSGEFIEPDPNLYSQLRELLDKYSLAVAVNNLWKFERAYIVHADTQDCNNDNRGPSESRACLPEFPSSSFWLYAINPSEEDDFAKDDQGLVRGPKGYRHFHSDHNSKWHGISMEDIVRSSMWVHQNHLQDSIKEFDFKHVVSLLQGRDEDVGKVPGAFQVPVCRNPGGESISSVHSKEARNYPCMCGEFGWNDGTWSLARDETGKFLELTGFKFSEDWEDYCSDHNHCKGENRKDWNFVSGPGEPKIPKKLKHPFKKCKGPKAHKTVGHPEKDFEAGGY